MQLEKTMLFPLIMLMMMLIGDDSDHFGDGVIDGDLVGDKMIFFQLWLHSYEHNYHGDEPYTYV